MKYNLTKRQKALARAITNAVERSIIEETFFVAQNATGSGTLDVLATSKWEPLGEGDFGQLDALARAGLLIFRTQSSDPYRHADCTVTEMLYHAVSTDFSEDEPIAAVSALIQPHPPEITISLERLRQKYPNANKLGFLIMRFRDAKPFGRIVQVIKDTAANYDLSIVRADEHEFHPELWGNIQTFLHGCGFGISIHERIETNEHNANIGLEIGYLMAMRKPLLLLKDRTLETLQSDLAGKLYKAFDPHDPEKTVPDLLKKWFADYGIAFPKP
jgi:hypothetical protein